MSFSIAGWEKIGRQSAGWEFPYQRSWEVELFLPSCWECGTDIFFPATEKNVKKALKAFTYHFYGLFVTICGNVSLSATEKVPGPIITTNYKLNRRTVIVINIYSLLKLFVNGMTYLPMLLR